VRTKITEIVVPELDESTTSYRRWSDRDVAVLVMYYGRAETKDIAKVLKRSKRAVQAKALELGLSFREVGNC
jgi:hypothetical protein